jgi:hypothetical protein
MAGSAACIRAVASAGTRLAKTQPLPANRRKIKNIHQRFMVEISALC